MRKAFTIIAILSFFVYLFVLFRLLLFRYAMPFSQVLENMRLPRYPSSYNLIPFRTIIGYVKMLTEGNVDGSLNRYIPIWNIIGNIIILMPLGFYLPFLIKKMAILKNFAITVSGMIISIELLQFIFRVGSLDIDDFILNLVGALISFVIFTHRPASLLLKLRT